MAIVVATLLNILDRDISENVAEMIVGAQNYDGGFGPQLGVESHGGFNFCCIGTLFLLQSLHKIELGKFLYLLANRQTKWGGFDGRTNKLVDSCYSF